MGQTCWSRRARSHSSPDMSSSIHRPTSLKGSLQRRGRWSASIRHALSGTGTGGDDSISDKERTEFRSDAGDSRREDAILKDWGEHDVARIFVD